MAVHWTDILDWAERPADYGPRFAHEGICLHTTEGSDRNDLDALLTTFKWQARSSSGSYNMGIGMNVGGDAGLSGDATVVTAVHMDNASGGISTRRDYIWAPERYPFLAKELSPRAYGDPNGALLNVVIRGSVAWWMGKDGRGRTRFERAGSLLYALAHIVVEFERRYGRFPVLCEHFHWQTNRSDADGRSGLLIALVEEYYRRLKGLPNTSTPTPSETMPKRMFVPQPWIAAANTPVYQSPDSTSEEIARLAGGPVVTIEEEAELVDGKRVTTGPWRTVVLGDWRTGFVNRSHLTPIEEGRVEYMNLVREVLFGTDLSNVQSPDELRALADGYRVKMEQAENEAEEMQAVIDALTAEADADAASLKEAVRVRDEALAAKSEIEASLDGVKSMVREYLDAMDGLREIAA